MKKYIILIAALAFMSFTSKAEGYMVVNTELIFKSIPSYESALKELDEAAQEQQDQIDAAFKLLEEKYNEYQKRKANLSTSRQKSIEQEIIDDEKRILEYQEEIFGQEGALFERRVELMTPIQEMVNKSMNGYAETNGYTLIMDISTNPMVLYYAPSVDKTDEVIELIKKLQ